MSTSTLFDNQIHIEQRDAFMGQLMAAVNGYFKILTIHLGSRLGLYGALTDDRGLTSEALAARTGTDERYVREWLEQQAVAGILQVADEKADAEKRRYALPSGLAEVLTDRESVNDLAPWRPGRRRRGPPPDCQGNRRAALFCE